MHCRTLFAAGLLWTVWAWAAEDQTVTSPLGNCAGRTDLGSHTIRSARVVDPFWILRWRRLDGKTLAAVEALKGKRYSFALVDEVSDSLEADGWLPDTPDTRVSLSFSDIVLENCADEKLDVVFHIFSAQLAPTASTVIEIRPKEKTMPSEGAGVSDAFSSLQLAPEAGFDPAQNFFAGGRLQAVFKPGAPISTLRLTGRGSNETRFFSSELGGEHNSSTAWLGHADWRLEYHNSLLPAEPRQVAQSRLAAQFAAASKPLNGVVFRFGGLLGGGNLQSSFQPSELGPDTVAASSFTSARLYVGVSGRARHQAYAASYGLGLGSTGRSFHGDWRKHVADVSHELWLPFCDHRLFEFEQRFTAGKIDVPGKIPVAERFFGGTRESLFIDSDQWRIRANPVIRSIPTNRFYRTGTGAGGDSFVAYNSTTAFTVWRRPVIPDELARDETFQKLLTGQVGSARSLLSVYYRSRDTHFTTIRNSLTSLAAKLTAVRSAKDTTQGAAPAELNPAFAACTKALGTSSLAVRNANKGRADSAYGWVTEMLPGGDNALAGVVSACGDLAAKLNTTSVDSSSLKSAVKSVADAAETLAEEFKAINNTVADAKAEADTKFVDKTLNFITREMNISSVSPLFIFDAARIGPATGSVKGTRYGVGGGIRFTLVSTVSVNLGYAVNPNRLPGESRGAFFFSLTTRNLLE